MAPPGECREVEGLNIGLRYLPMPSMHGMFTYIWLLFYGKCRYNIPYMDAMGDDKNLYEAPSKYIIIV